ncbi:hypothetical protein Trydic_g20958 [Trypoxylus dichotomus]
MEHFVIQSVPKVTGGGNVPNQLEFLKQAWDIKPEHCITANSIGRSLNHAENRLDRFDNEKSQQSSQMEAPHASQTDGSTTHVAPTQMCLCNVNVLILN